MRSRSATIRSEVTTTRRSEVGAITDTGRLIRMPVLDLPAAPANSVQLGAGVRVSDYLALDAKREKIVGLVSLTSAVPVALAPELWAVLVPFPVVAASAAALARAGGFWLPARSHPRPYGGPVR